MKAVWTVGGMKGEPEDALDFIRDLGFNTMITGDATPELVDYARGQGICVIATILPVVDGAFETKNSHAIQRPRDFESKIFYVLAKGPRGTETDGTYLWHSLIKSASLCFGHPESQDALEARVEKALEFADGIAFHFFGFKNHYACFCKRCENIRTDMKAAHPTLPDLEILSRMSEQTLLDIHQILFDRAKTINPDAIVTNHIWPPFRPDEYFGYIFKLDYCTQTISWFFLPAWRLERVGFEAAELRRLENPCNNQFVPFIGIHELGDLVRSPERFAKELEIVRCFGVVDTPRSNIYWRNRRCVNERSKVFTFAKAS